MSYRKTIATLSAIAASGALAAPAVAHAPAGHDGDSGSGSAPRGRLQAIAQCESGGDPTAIGGGGAYRGKYQFSYSTWASVGGSGDPAAAPEREQDKRAAVLLAQSGSSPWPVCGR
jgi:transglycosylase-like protein